MPQQLVDSFILWAGTAAIGALAIVLWWMARRLIIGQDHIAKQVTQLHLSLTEEVGKIKERLAMIEGYLWPRK